MPKKKGDKGGNPNPVQTDVFKAKQNSRANGDIYPGEPLAEKPLTVKVYKFVYDAIAALPRNEKAVRLRQLLTEFAINKLGATPLVAADIPRVKPTHHKIRRANFVTRKSKKKDEKPFLISYEWDSEKIPILEMDLISKHPELELIIGSLGNDEKFFMQVGSPGSIITIESNWDCH